ncbi:MAG: translocated intimin receptor Tir [Acidobacteria bacterium]|nr:translocated intimin receptor Tir [Acidobacteriota bacterium]MBV9145776.1 translocated intimin receptor Tir [Acidobacteriota bacterium]MBV9436875.1 translocated intimin receptor Tir [Acidobacteriota bacterium]
MAQRGLAKAILTDIHFVIPVLVLLGGIVLLVKLH